MRLHIMSDLHMDLRPDYGKEFVKKRLHGDKQDVLVLAGDVCSLAADNEDKTRELLASMAELYKALIFVPGNHEYWNTSPAEAQKLLAKLESEIKNLKVLRADKVVEIEGRRFLGDTMWFPFDPSNFMYEKNMPDFRMIFNFTTWPYQQNSVFTAFLRKECKPGDIVVTHHMPSFKSVPERYQNSQINRFFVSDQRKVIEKNRPGLWIHGHTHTKFDYMLGDTRILCNPRGYIGEQSVHVWNPSLKIEV